ncbi:MAG: endonuclease MutS2 [Deltaproteobacteria bacterium]|nr:endonuclease MutS2 [Candidatus Anaeroferrophillus wilburensis]MBN2888635.1 endonuclease MutS2 [Deltaproteobacteria bacterium]
MEHHAARVLDFAGIIRLVARHAMTPRGKAACQCLFPLSAASFAGLSAGLCQVVLFMDLVGEYGSVPLGGIQDLGPDLQRIRIEDTYLLPHSLLVFAETFRCLDNVSQFAAVLDEPFVPLRELFDGISSFRPLMELINSCIDDQEGIKDEASFALADIRRQIRTTRQKVQAILANHLDNPALQPIIQDHLVTVRNNRYVIPVKPNFKTFFSGIIHDQSRTHMTFFVEPVETIGLNNTLGILRKEEQEEEIRILKMIALHLRAERQQIMAVLERVFHLDMIQAKALFGRETGGTSPRLAADWSAGFSLQQARHPLLVAEKTAAEVVPVDIIFAPGIQGLVISGANTGGKTVTLKTLGLISFMARCALPLPVDRESVVPLFCQVLADIGDEQSISEDLSTFSGHLKNIDAILADCNERTLVLFDELGVGTDPQEGSALALGILDELHDRQAAFVVTTHYNNVKAYAYERPWIESVAVSFDSQSMKPLYRLHYGVPGLSNALNIAQRLQVNRSIIDRARSYLDREHDQVVMLAEKLEKRLAQVDVKERELFRLKQQAYLLEEECRKERERLLEARENLRQTATRQVAQITRQAEDRFKELLAILEAQRREGVSKEMKTGALRHDFSLMKKQVGDLLPEAPPAAPPTPVPLAELLPGVRVRLAGTSHPAEVESVDQQKKLVTVSLGGNLKASLPLKKIVAIIGKSPTGRLGQVRVRSSSPGDIPLTLNLIGKRVEEAREELMRYLDQAVRANIQQVEIVHGFGTGRLREGVHELLREIHYVSDFYHPSGNEGGKAVTVVKLAGE